MATPIEMDHTASSHYRQLSNGNYVPTLHSQGAWSPDEQHVSPLGGLIAHAIEQFEPRDDLQLAKITQEIFGPPPLDEFSIDVEILRPGKTIELIGATVTSGGRTVVKATAWRLVRVPTEAVAGTHDEPLPPPDQMDEWNNRELWTGGWIDSLSGRVLDGREPGRGKLWLRTDKDLVEGVHTSDTANFLRMVDTANGIATRVHPDDWLFPNTDLTIHLYRTPEGPWVGFDTTVNFGPSGVGVTSSVLHDLDGPVGRSEQILTIRPRPK